MLDSLTERVLAIATDHARDIRERLASGHARRCSICGDVEYDGYDMTYTAGYRTYAPDCPECNLPMNAAHFYLRLRDHAYVEYSDTTFMPCSCRTTLVPEMNAHTLTSQGEYHIPLPKIINKQIENHHVSYEPEISVPVCSTCHGQIHADNGKLTAFEPDIERDEWEHA